MNTDRVVVIPPREMDDPTLAVAELLSAALADSSEEGQSAAGPIAVPAPSIDVERDVDLSRAAAALCVEPEGLVRAVEARVPLRIAYLASLESDWEGGLGLAHAVLVPHAALVDAALGLGARRQTVHVVPALAGGDRTDSSPDAIRRELGLVDAGPLVLVPAQAMDEDLTPFLVQFALTREGPSFVFDVGRDTRAAALLKERVVAYGLDAFMVADTAVGAKLWSAADVVVARLGGPELVRALAVGAPLLVLARRGGEELAARPLAAASIATVGGIATLAVAVDEATRATTIAAARAAIGAPSHADATRQVVDVIREIVRNAGRVSLSPELPQGLLRISAASGRPAGGGKSERTKREPEADVIERELAALRARLAQEK